MSEDIFIVKNYLKDMEFSIKYQIYFEINYEQTKEFYNSIHKLLKEIERQKKEIEENQVLIDDIKDHRIVYNDTPEFEERYIDKDKIREIIGKYIDIQEHKKYINQELYGEDLKNMINELLEEN